MTSGDKDDGCANWSVFALLNFSFLFLIASTSQEVEFHGLNKLALVLDSDKIRAKSVAFRRWKTGRGETEVLFLTFLPCHQAR